MTKREKRVVNAFIECVKSGEYSLEYAITLLEDNNKYGYLTDEAKEEFYSAFEGDESIAEVVITPDEIIEDIPDTVEPTVDESVDSVTENVEVTEEGAENGETDTEVTESE